LQTNANKYLLAFGDAYTKIVGNRIMFYLYDNDLLIANGSFQSGVLLDGEKLTPESVADKLSPLFVKGGDNPPTPQDDKIRVRFLDHSGYYDKQLFIELGSDINIADFPAPREFEGLAFDGWNWSDEDLLNIGVVSHLVTPEIVIGATYITNITTLSLQATVRTELDFTFNPLFTDESTWKFTLWDGTEIIRNGIAGQSVRLPFSFSLPDIWNRYIITAERLSGTGTMTLGSPITGGSININEAAIWGRATLRLIAGIGVIVGHRAFLQFTPANNLISNIVCFEAVFAGRQTEFGSHLFTQTRSLPTTYVIFPKSTLRIASELFHVANNVIGYSVPKTFNFMSQSGITQTVLSGWLGQAVVDYIYLPSDNAITRIGAQVFDGNTYKGKRVTIGANINGAVGTFNATTNAAGSLPFFQCKEFELLGNVTDIGNECFFNSPNLETIILPTTVQRIGRQAFRGCRRLRNINLPEGLTDIAANAFMEAISRTEQEPAVITFPSTLLTLGTGLFDQARALSSVIMLGSTPPTTTTTMFGAIAQFEQMRNAGMKIYVPDDAVTAYRTATNWSLYAAVIEPMSSMPQKVGAEFSKITAVGMSMKIMPMSASIQSEVAVVEPKTIAAEDGKVFKRKHDEFIIGHEVVLGIDFSTGVEREDRAEYYEQIDAPADDKAVEELLY